MNAEEIKEGINKIPDDLLEKISHSEFSTQDISGGKIGEKGMKAIKVLGVLTLLGGTTATGFVFGRKNKIKSERKKILEDYSDDMDAQYSMAFKTGMALQHNDFGDDLNKYKPKVDINKLTEDEKHTIKYALGSSDKIDLLNK